MEMYEWLRPLVIGVAVIGALTLWGRLGARRPAVGRAGDVREIKYGRGGILVLLAALVGIGGLALWACFFAQGGSAALALGLAFAAMALLCAGFLMPAHKVTWDDMSLTGPTSYMPWPFGPSRGTIRYEKIERFGLDWASSWFVEDAAGIRIRWSYLYAGFPALMLAIEDARPDLFPAEEPA